MVSLTTKKTSALVLLVTLRYCSWWSNQFTSIKLRHHILETIGVYVWRWIVLLCLSIAIIGTGQPWCWQIHTRVIIIRPFSNTRHDEIIQLILVVRAFHGIDCGWWSLIPRWAFFCPFFYHVIHVVMKIILTHFRLRNLSFDFELFRVLLRIAVRVNLFKLN